MLKQQHDTASSPVLETKSATGAVIGLCSLSYELTRFVQENERNKLILVGFSSFASSFDWPRIPWYLFSSIEILWYLSSSTYC